MSPRFAGADVTVVDITANDGREAVYVRVSGLSPEAMGRELRRLRVRTGVEYPAIPAVLEGGVVEDDLYYVLPKLAARSLGSLLGSRELSARLVISVGEQVARALAILHDRGVVHTRVSADTIAVNALGQPVLLDFGWIETGAAPAELRVREDWMAYPAWYYAHPGVTPAVDVAMLVGVLLTGLMSIGDPTAAELEVLLTNILAADPEELPSAAGLAKLLRGYLDGRPQRESKFPRNLAVSLGRIGQKDKSRWRGLRPGTSFGNARTQEPRSGRDGRKARRRASRPSGLPRHAFEDVIAALERPRLRPLLITVGASLLVFDRIRELGRRFAIGSRVRLSAPEPAAAVPDPPVWEPEPIGGALAASDSLNTRLLERTRGWALSETLALDDLPSDFDRGEGARLLESGQLLSVPDVTGEPRFPRWQFVATGGWRWPTRIHELRRTFPGDDFALAAWAQRPLAALSDSSPAEVWVAGREDEVVALAGALTAAAR
jgi:hypothetical protein